MKCQWENCNHIVNTELELHTHLLTNHAIEGRQVCKWLSNPQKPPCSTACRHRGQFCDHITSHFNIAFKPYTCTVCGMAFRSRKDIRNHSKTHGIKLDPKSTLLEIKNDNVKGISTVSSSSRKTSKSSSLLLLSSSSSSTGSRRQSFKNDTPTNTTTTTIDTPTIPPTAPAAISPMVVSKVSNIDNNATSMGPSKADKLSNTNVPIVQPQQSFNNSFTATSSVYNNALDTSFMLNSSTSGVNGMVNNPSYDISPIQPQQTWNTTSSMMSPIDVPIYPIQYPAFDYNQTTNSTTSVSPGYIQPTLMNQFIPQFNNNHDITFNPSLDCTSPSASTMMTSANTMTTIPPTMMTTPTAIMTTASAMMTIPPVVQNNSMATAPVIVELSNNQNNLDIQKQRVATSSFTSLVKDKVVETQSKDESCDGEIIQLVDNDSHILNQGEEEDYTTPPPVFTLLKSLKSLVIVGRHPSTYYFESQVLSYFFGQPLPKEYLQIAQQSTKDGTLVSYQVGQDSDRWVQNKLESYIKNVTRGSNNDNEGSSSSSSSSSSSDSSRNLAQQQGRNGLVNVRFVWAKIAFGQYIEESMVLYKEGLKKYVENVLKRISSEKEKVERQQQQETVFNRTENIVLVNPTISSSSSSNSRKRLFLQRRRRRLEFILFEGLKSIYTTYAKRFFPVWTEDVFQLVTLKSDKTRNSSNNGGGGSSQDEDDEGGFCRVCSGVTLGIKVSLPYAKNWYAVQRSKLGHIVGVHLLKERIDFLVQECFEWNSTSHHHHHHRNFGISSSRSDTRCGGGEGGGGGLGGHLCCGNVFSRLHAKLEFFGFDDVQGTTSGDNNGEKEGCSSSSSSGIFIFTRVGTDLDYVKEFPKLFLDGGGKVFNPDIVVGERFYG